MIGLDMDHTLVRYHTEAFEGLVYQFAINALVADKTYPEMVTQLKFNFQDAIRGLVIDSQNGNILKLSRYGIIKQCRHGTKLKTYKEQTEFYRSTYIDLNDHNYIAIDTAFSIAFCALYAQLVDLKDQFPHLFPNYRQIALDTIDVIDKIHAKGEMKAHILKNHPQFIQISEEIVTGIKRFIQFGKKFFILTNSDYHYTKQLLKITIEPFLDYNQKIEDLFPYIITLANKPRFFYDNLNFLKVHSDSELMSNMSGAIEPGIYQGGNAKKFTKDLNLQDDEILYIGDHIYGDIVRLKKDCNWRTALVVDELGDEILRQQRATPTEDKIIHLMKIKQELEIEYAWELTQEPASLHERPRNIKLDNIQAQLFEIDKQLTLLIKEQDGYFNKNWGKIFRAGAEETFFAFQAERYACIYMEKLQDLLGLPPMAYFRAYRRMLSHDISA
jgi:HAD superfamily 5'-nucleotidase-like hydrolase